MKDFAPVTALGLMSGTSLDGIDAALLDTDGEHLVAPGPSRTFPYETELRERLRAVLGGCGDVSGAERALTEAHARAVASLLDDTGIGPDKVRVIGFHGHTILHRPDEGRTWQIGDGALLASATGIDVINDFRSADIAAGGEGAPLAPAYHWALASQLERPVAVLNVGGVANATWIGADGIEEMIAFDTGPGNALLDDWVRHHTRASHDADGALARAGRVDRDALARLLDHPYFRRRPPKSLDRDDFDRTSMEHLSAADGAATLTAFTAAAVGRAASFFPWPVRRWLVTGGGRRNPALMAALTGALEASVAPVESVGWDGDSLEAYAFAYLAVRSLRGLPLSFPGTTGCRTPVSGGTLHRAPV